jgi:hypothetical protein
MFQNKGIFFVIQGMLLQFAVFISSLIKANNYSGSLWAAAPIELR